MFCCAPKVVDMGNGKFRCECDLHIQNRGNNVDIDALTLHEKYHINYWEYVEAYRANHENHVVMERKECVSMRCKCVIEEEKRLKRVEREEKKLERDANKRERVAKNLERDEKKRLNDEKAKKAAIVDEEVAEDLAEKLNVSKKTKASTLTKKIGKKCNDVNADSEETVVNGDDGSSGSGSRGANEKFVYEVSEILEEETKSIEEEMKKAKARKASKKKKTPQEMIAEMEEDDS